LGVLPGEKVLIENLAMKLDSMGNVFGSKLAITRIMPSDAYGKMIFPQMKQTAVLDSRTFQDHVISGCTGMINVRCSLSYIDEIKFTAYCQLCATPVFAQVCANGCKDVDVTIDGNAKFVAEDGTMQVVCDVKNYSCIAKLMNLTHLQKLTLHRRVSDSGCWSFSAYRSDEQGAIQSECSDWIKEVCHSRRWQRQVRILGRFSSIPKEAFHETSPSCIKSPDMLRNSTFKLSSGVTAAVAAIKRIYFKVESVGEIDPLHEISLTL
jgi:hypothetical protein